MTDKSLDELKHAFNVLLDIPHVEVDEVESDREGNFGSPSIVQSMELVVISAVILLIIVMGRVSLLP